MAILLLFRILQGHVITKVEAIDGDRGRPRRIKYGLVSENRPFTVLFEIGLFSGINYIRRLLDSRLDETDGNEFIFNFLSQVR